MKWRQERLIMIKWWQSVKHWWKRYWYLIVIVAVGAGLRCWRLGELPQGLNRDEAAIAYNSYLLTHASKDEWERVWPVFLESFGDQKLPGYPYILVGMWKIGLDKILQPDLLVRLPSLLAGIALIVLAYGFGQLYGNHKHYRWSGILAASLVSFNPIFIWYSRGAWEANLGLFFWVLAVYLITWSWCQQKDWTVAKLLVIIVSLLASFLTYNAPLLITSVLLLILPWILGKRGWQWWGPLVVTVGVAVATSWLLLLPVTRQKGGITIFSDPTVNHYYLLYREKLPHWLRPMLGSKYVYLTGKLAGNTINSVSVWFFLEGGSHPWHQLNGFGHLTRPSMLLVYLALVFGFGLIIWIIYTAVKKRQLKIIVDSIWVKGLILGLCLLIPSVITTDCPHATRSLEFFYFLLIATVLILSELFGSLTLKYVKRQSVVIFAVVMSVWQVLAMTVYIHAYFTKLPQQNIYAQGMGEVLESLDSKRLTLVRSVERPYEYIKFAWELKITPSLFWQTIVRENADLAGIKAGSDLLNYHFSDIDFDDPAYPQVIWYNKEIGKWERVR